MRPSANRKKTAASFEEFKPVCRLLILHEDFPAYSRAVEVCRRMMERFATQVDFSIKCWNFIELADPNCARHAARTAAGADIILISAQAAHWPAEIEGWLDSLAGSVLRPGGVLALLAGHTEAGKPASTAGTKRLTALAARLGLTFRRLLPDDEKAIVRPPRLLQVRGHHSSPPAGSGQHLCSGTAGV